MARNSPPAAVRACTSMARYRSVSYTHLDVYKRQGQNGGKPMTGAIAVTDDGAIRIIRMNRPEKKNALTRAMYADMSRALREAGQSDAIRCVMFTGTAGVFSAGNDIADFLNTANTGLHSPVLEFLDALAHSQKPMVAAVGGIAVGIEMCIRDRAAAALSPRQARPTRFR